MGRDGEDGDLSLVRAVIPENPPSRGRFVFGVGLENLLAAGPFERTELVGVEAGMAGIGLQQTQGLSHRLESLRQPGICLQCGEVGIRLVREKQFEGHGSVDFVVGKFGEAAARFHAALSGLAQALLDGGQRGLVVEQPLLAGGDFRVGFQDDAPLCVRRRVEATDAARQLAQSDAPLRVRADGECLCHDGNPDTGGKMIKWEIGQFPLFGIRSFSNTRIQAGGGFGIGSPGGEGGWKREWYWMG